MKPSRLFLFVILSVLLLTVVSSRVVIEDERFLIQTNIYSAEATINDTTWWTNWTAYNASWSAGLDTWIHNYSSYYNITQINDINTSQTNYIAENNASINNYILYVNSTAPSGASDATWIANWTAFNSTWSSGISGTYANSTYVNIDGDTMTGDLKLSGFTNGSVLFISHDGVITQNNSKLYYENDNGGKFSIGDNSNMLNFFQVVKEEGITDVDNIRALIVSRNTGTTDDNWVGFSMQTEDSVGDVYSGVRLLTQFTNHTNVSGDFVIDTRHEGNRSEKLRLTSLGNLNLSGNFTAVYYCNATNCYTISDFFSDTDTTWVANWTAFNSTWSFTYNSTQNNSINNYILYVNSTNSGAGASDATWIANWTAYNSTWSSITNSSYVPYINATGNVNIGTHNYIGNSAIFGIVGGSYTEITNSKIIFDTGAEAGKFDFIMNQTTNNLQLVKKSGTGLFEILSNVNVSKNITADYYFGDGSQLTGVSGAETTWIANWTAYNSTWSSITNSSYVSYSGATGNVDLGSYNLSADWGVFNNLNMSGNIHLFANKFLYFGDTDDSIFFQSLDNDFHFAGTGITYLTTTEGLFNFTGSNIDMFEGNVTANYFFGNGSQLTDISAGDNTWVVNWSAYNDTWSAAGSDTWVANYSLYYTSTQSDTQNTSQTNYINSNNASINNYILYVNSTNGAGSGDGTWVANWTAFNSTWSFDTTYSDLSEFNNDLNIGNWTEDKSSYYTSTQSDTQNTSQTNYINYVNTSVSNALDSIGFNSTTNDSINNYILYVNSTNLGRAGTLIGGGTAWYIPAWNGTTSLNNSVIYQDEDNISIGINNATQKFVVDSGNLASPGFIGLRMNNDNRFIKIGNPGSDTSIISWDDNDQLTFGTEASFTDDGSTTFIELMRIEREGGTDNSLVGINNSDPQQTLSVVGDANITGLIYGNGSQLTDIYASDGATWIANWTAYNSTWSSTYNFTQNSSINNYILYVNSTNGAGSGDGTWIANWTAYNSTWSSDTWIANYSLYYTKSEVDTINTSVKNTFVELAGDTMKGELKIEDNLNVTKNITIGGGLIWWNGTHTIFS